MARQLPGLQAKQLLVAVHDQVAPWVHHPEEAVPPTAREAERRHGGDQDWLDVLGDQYQQQRHHEVVSDAGRAQVAGDDALGARGFWHARRTLSRTRGTRRLPMGRPPWCRL